MRASDFVRAPTDRRDPGDGIDKRGRRCWQCAASTRVLEGAFGKLTSRHDQATLVPDAYDDIGRPDLLDPTLFPFNNYAGVDSYWFAERQRSDF